MPDFAYARLRRFPDVEAPNLQAWDATDELLVARALTTIEGPAISGSVISGSVISGSVISGSVISGSGVPGSAISGSGVPGSAIVVIGDGYGALTLPLVESGLTGVRVHQDLVTGRRALQRNAAELGLLSSPAPAPAQTPASENGDASGASRLAEAGHAENLLRFPAGDPSGTPPFTPHELDEELLRGARMVLLQLPKSLGELEEIADAIARWAAPDVVVLAGGRVKHMILAQNEVLGRYFARVQPQRAERKSRLILATHPLPVPSDPPFPVSTTHHKPAIAVDPLSVSHDLPFPVSRPHRDPAIGADPRPVVQDPPFPVSSTHAVLGLTLCAHGGAFAGDRVDIGTRVLLDVIRDRSAELAALIDRGPFTALDLGCGTGALAASFALAHPAARVIATDRSAAAVRSACATMLANGVADRVSITLDDAGSEIPGGSVDLILLNPPFHLGASVHEGAGRRLIDAAARLLRPGGEVWTVFNSHLDHRRALADAVGPTEQLARTPKFTVTRSTRR